MKQLVFVAVAALALTSCVIVDDRRSGPPGVKSGGPPPWAPAHGYRAKQARHYYYYPDAGVYFDVGTKTYFYMNGGTWQVAVSLPPTVVLDSTAYVSLELDTDTPYLYYDEHQHKYKGKKPKKEKHHGRPF